MEKVNFSEMTISEIQGLIKDATAALRLKVQVDSITKVSDFKKGDKVKVLSGAWWPKLVGKEFEVMNVGRTRVQVMFEEKPYNVATSFVTKVPNKVVVPEVKATKK